MHIEIITQKRQVVSNNNGLVCLTGYTLEQIDKFFYCPPCWQVRQWLGSR